jgi:S1-C subfamily serine protease
MSHPKYPRPLTAAALAAGAALSLAAGLALRAADLNPKVREAEQKRIAAIEKVQPAVVAVVSGGGSGVLISEDGFALTNFHVVEGARGGFMKCGLPDGNLYDAVLVGLDKVGDVALIKLLPKKDGDKIVAPKDGKFPFAPLGDSDKVQAGDWSLAMGNPFLLATDFTPTVTYGLVSGVHRYQYPAGTLLEYTDCIQIDTSINPGNSGGPLFNMNGELIGINGRGSFEKRGRVNSGVGYAISINQIKNFMGQLKAGMDTDHASLGALIESASEDGPLNKMVVQRLIECDASRRGLDLGDQLVSFAGRPIQSVNAFKNALGLYPRGWRMPLVYRRENDKLAGSERREILVRLMGVQRQELPGQGGDDDPNKPKPQPQPRPAGPPEAKPDPSVAKFYEAKPGFANYYFNRMERDRLLAEFRKRHGDFTKAQGDWSLKAAGTLGSGANKGKKVVAQVTIKDRGGKDGKSDLVQAVIDGVDYSFEPLDPNVRSDVLKDPPGSGGFLLALYHYRQVFGLDGKSMKEFSHGGTEPFYPPPPSDTARPDYAKLRVDCEVLRTELAGVTAKWYFSQKDFTLLGFELSTDRDEDPCEVYFTAYEKDSDGRDLPKRIEVRYGDKVYAVLDVGSFKLEAAK